MSSSQESNGLSFRCLIADDSAFARKNIAHVVEKIGGRVVAEAANGLETIRFFEQLRPDLVLLDVTMPLLDGVETLRRIMAIDPQARVIMVSSLGHKEMIWKAICVGARSFVTKPFNPEYAGMLIKDVLLDKGTTSKAS